MRSATFFLTSIQLLQLSERLEKNIKTGSVSKKKLESAKTERTPENVERVLKAILKSSKRSARKRVDALRLSDRTVRQILHEYLNFFPYKLAVVQKLSAGNFLTRKRACEAFVENVSKYVDKQKCDIGVEQKCDCLVFVIQNCHYSTMIL